MRRVMGTNTALAGAGLLGLQIISAVPAHAQQPLSSAAVDATIYREGEVKRFVSEHDRWQIVCDEITRLQKRFCSLRSAVLNVRGERAGEVTISTGQDGRPAALLRLRAALVGAGFVEIASVQAEPAIAPNAATAPGKTSGKRKATASPPVVPATRLRPVVCDASVCTLIWTLRLDQIDALNDGNGLSLQMTTGGDPGNLAPVQAKPRDDTQINISATGFKDAVARSLQPFQ
jgi:invasion protein IalB